MPLVSARIARVHTVSRLADDVPHGPVGAVADGASRWRGGGGDVLERLAKLVSEPLGQLPFVAHVGDCEVLAADVKPHPPRSVLRLYSHQRLKRDSVHHPPPLF